MFPPSQQLQRTHRMGHSSTQKAIEQDAPSDKVATDIKYLHLRQELQAHHNARSAASAFLLKGTMLSAASDGASSTLMALRAARVTCLRCPQDLIMEGHEPGLASSHDVSL